MIQIILTLQITLLTVFIVYALIDKALGKTLESCHDLLWAIVSFLGIIFSKITP
jgi:hypothetical protein